MLTAIICLYFGFCYKRESDALFPCRSAKNESISEINRLKPEGKNHFCRYLKCPCVMLYCTHGESQIMGADLNLFSSEKVTTFSQNTLSSSLCGKLNR